VLVDVKVPILAESVAEATLMNWHKQPGETVTRGDSLIDIETDKVTLEVAALNNGILAEVLKGDGENVSSDEIIARIETEAATSGLQVSEKEDNRTDEPQQQSLPVGDIPDQGPKLSPAVRNLLGKYKLDASSIPTRKGDGRLTKEDVLDYVRNNKAVAPVTKTPELTETVMEKSAQSDTDARPETENKPPQPVQTKAVKSDTASAAPVNSATTEQRREERVPMTRLRRRVAERLLSAQQENAILTSFNEINMHPVMDLRTRYKEEFEKKHNIRLGFMSFFTKAVVEALKNFPIINASVDGEDIIYHGYFDIGIAVSSPRGLVVPIVRDADLLSFAEIERTIRGFGDKARDSKLTIEELTGGTFTITNGGVFGSLLSTPIINPPQSAILGMHTIQERPVAENGEVVIRPLMYVALSYDHRIIDGSDAVQFLVTVKQLLEDPDRLLLQI